jgi:hypothetical protein
MTDENGKAGNPAQRQPERDQSYNGQSVSTPSNRCTLLPEEKWRVGFIEILPGARNKLPTGQSFVN